MSSVGLSGASSQSHPARGAWIEISQVIPIATSRSGRTPHGVRGLKLAYNMLPLFASGGRTPHGVRGLKYGKFRRGHNGDLSHPARGAWIEITLAWKL